MDKILLLAGTHEARDLAERLSEAGADFVVSVAGRADTDYPGPIRRGGFGGEEGLAEVLEAENFAVIADATHPFADTISINAKKAAKRTRRRYLRLSRLPWRRSWGDRWTTARSLEEAAQTLDEHATVFLAVGAGGIAPFLARRDLKIIARTIAPPDLGDRDDIEVITGRGPFTVDDERALWQRYRFDTLVTKNAGGDATAAKLVVARETSTRVVMVRRPKGQPWPSARSVDQMMRKLRRHL